MAIHVQRNVFFLMKPQISISVPCHHGNQNHWFWKIMDLSIGCVKVQRCSLMKQLFVLQWNRKAFVFHCFAQLSHLLSQRDLYVSIHTPVPQGRHLYCRVGDRKKATRYCSPKKANNTFTPDSSCITKWKIVNFPLLRTCSPGLLFQLRLAAT